ncbi:hypothetical protein PIROE2DRAFT_69477 [Piromyces sp. E2]|nr:hypothetical protein PIROE2DRAFT_69477 [Piromyces sp. E2]|eukprot:OUM62630.1 hypothetical protein PIROE2DRAFT_69477 [Piromyces sp. E2]
MKFTTRFLTVLAAASTVFSAAIPKKEEKIEVPKLAPVITDKDCAEYIKKNSQCPPHGVYSDAKNYEDDCTKFESETCQKFYKTKLIDVPECKNERKTVLLGYQELFQSFYSIAKFQCGKDEKGNSCPLSPIGLQKNYGFNVVVNQTLAEPEVKKIYTQAIKDTCSSQKCSNDYLDIIKEYENDHKQFFDEAAKEKDFSEDDRKGFEELFKDESEQNFKDQPIKDFKDQCKATTSNAKPSDAKSSDAKSDATRITYTSALVVTIGLLLSSLY